VLHAIGHECDSVESSYRRAGGGGKYMVMYSSHPGSKGVSRGLKQALVTSRKLISAFPPSSVPKSVERERSGATGARWVALALAWRGQSWRTWATVWLFSPHLGQ
jgi:hypothetical protein